MGIIQSPPPGDKMIHLGPNLWFDPDAIVIIRSHEVIPLTAQEGLVMRALVHVMRARRGFVSASDLASQVVTRDTYLPAHAVQETISNIRRKLGESPRAPKILVTRRGIGYRLCPQPEADASR